VNLKFAPVIPRRRSPKRDAPPNMIRCKPCDALFPAKEYERHYNVNHRVKRPRVIKLADHVASTRGCHCEPCEMAFKTLAELQRHQQDVHGVIYRVGGPS
jgi:uncharacterized C2H2 Zn-finger protein